MAIGRNMARGGCCSLNNSQAGARSNEEEDASIDEEELLKALTEDKRFVIDDPDNSVYFAKIRVARKRDRLIGSRKKFGDEQ